MVNNDRSTQRVTIMARRPSPDDIWNEIFDSLVLDNEPPFEYIKNVLITTKTGVRLRVSAVDFAQILERERFLTPDESDILSCKLAINFSKVRKDVDEWADQVMYFFNHDGRLKPPAKKPTKRKVATPAKKTAKANKDEIAAVAKTMLETSKGKTAPKKPAAKKNPGSTNKKS